MNENEVQLTKEDYDSAFQSTSEQLDKAVDDCRKRMNNLTAE